MGSRVVVITGASSGIGRAAARAFSADGDAVVLVARGRADLEAVAAELPGESLVVPADVLEIGAVEEAAAAAVRRFGRIDVWVDSAAVMAYGKFLDLPVEVFERVVRTDLLGPSHVARVALGQFRAQGHGTLIFVSSLLARIATPHMSAYITAKWGLRGLVRSLRQELRDQPDIHVCNLIPGSVDTPIYTSAANYAGFVGRPPPPVDTAERMGKAALALARRPRYEKSVGVANRMIEFGFVALPPVYDALVGPMMKSFGLSRQSIEPHDGNVYGSRARVEGGPARFGRGTLAVAAVVALSLAGWRRLR